MAHTIVIAGAGFAGIEAALHLRDLASKKDLDIRVFDKSKYFTYQPSLHMLATGVKSKKAITIDLELLFSKKGIRFYPEAIDKVNPKTKTIYSENRKVDFDYLIIGTGTVNNYRNVPGAPENALCLKTLADADKIKNSIHHLIDKTKVYSQPPKIVVIGTGLTGVEMAAELADMVKKRAQVILVGTSSHILKGFSFDAIGYAEKILKKKGVDLQFNKSVSKIDSSKVSFRDKSEIYSSLTIWCGGVRANPVNRRLGLRTNEYHFIMVNNFLQTNFLDVFAVGDCAYQFKTPQAMTAQTASAQGKLAAGNIWARINDKELVSYLPKQSDYKYLVSLGKYKAFLFSQKSLLKGLIPYNIKAFVEKEFLFKRKNWIWPIKKINLK